MSNLMQSINSTRIKQALSSVRLGDWLVILASMIAIVVLFLTQWQMAPATKVQVRVADKIYATYSLNLVRNIEVQGTVGKTTLQISQGRARFLHAPCHQQYCVRQAWLTRAGQVAICLPNQVSLELIGEKKLYDSLNY